MQRIYNTQEDYDNDFADMQGELFPDTYREDTSRYYLNELDSEEYEAYLQNQLFNYNEEMRKAFWTLDNSVCLMSWSADNFLKMLQGEIFF